MDSVITDKYELYHGDCVEVMKQIPEHSIDMVLCDLPYVHSARKSTARYNCEMLDEDNKEMLNILLTHNSKFLISGYDNDLYNVLTDNGWFKHSFKSPSSESIETLWWNYNIEGK